MLLVVWSDLSALSGLKCCFFCIVCFYCMFLCLCKPWSCVVFYLTWLHLIFLSLFFSKSWDNIWKELNLDFSRDKAAGHQVVWKTSGRILCLKRCSDFKILLFFALKMIISICRRALKLTAVHRQEVRTPCKAEGCCECFLNAQTPACLTWWPEQREFLLHCCYVTFHREQQQRNLVEIILHCVAEEEKRGTSKIRIPDLNRPEVYCDA